MNDNFNWICAIIDSCNNDFHFSSVDSLIELFNTKYKNEEKLTQLTTVRWQKWNEIHQILK